MPSSKSTISPPMKPVLSRIRPVSSETTKRSPSRSSPFLHTRQLVKVVKKPGILTGGLRCFYITSHCKYGVVRLFVCVPPCIGTRYESAAIDSRPPVVQVAPVKGHLPYSVLCISTIYLLHTPPRRHPNRGNPNCVLRKLSINGASRLRRETWHIGRTTGCMYYEKLRMVEDVSHGCTKNAMTTRCHSVHGWQPVCG
jgi:hypothetical protein